MALEKSKSTRPVPFQFLPTNFKELMDLANIIADSDLAPKDYKGKPGNCVVAIQMGAEVGLQPMQSLQNISVINGRPSIWGDAALALVIASPYYESVEEWEEGDFDAGTLVAWCKARSTNGRSMITSFSIKDAKRAGLWGKAGPWTQYPRRMMQMRSRGFTLRDVFPNVLKGLNIAEEALDLPPEDFHVVKAEPIKKRGIEGLIDKLSAISNSQNDSDSKEDPVIEQMKQEFNAVEIDNKANEIINDINSAQTIEDLIHAADKAKILPEEDREKIRPVYKIKERELNSKSVQSPN